MQKNTSQFKSINIFNIGLGVKNGNFKLYLSDDKENYGGVSLHPEVEGNLRGPFSECKVKMTWSDAHQNLRTLTLHL